MHEALNNWGNALADQARQKSGEAADNLFTLAYDKYSEALQIKPDMHDAFYNWGGTLIHQARQKSGEAAAKLHNQAFEFLSKAVALGGHCYNFACINALRGDADTAYRYLDKALSTKEISPEFVEEDDDWISLKDRKEFIDILNRHRDNE